MLSRILFMFLTAVMPFIREGCYTLGGPSGQVTIQPQLFFNKDLDYLLTSDKEQKIALSISKLKAARYLDFGLEELVPSLWVESECEYDISAAYGITHLQRWDVDKIKEKLDHMLKSFHLSSTIEAWRLGSDSKREYKRRRQRLQHCDLEKDYKQEKLFDES
ncbi:hypothetical protein Tco_0967512 [Tanacetum coccineum]